MMINLITVKKILHKSFKRLGYTITNDSVFKGQSSNFFASHKWLIELNFLTILDIGANKGQFASKFRMLFPNAFIYSFEPIQEIFEILNNRFSKDLKFKSFNLGLGLESGEFDFFQKDFSDSSSLMRSKDLLKENFPQTQNEKKIKIQIESLDNISNSINLELPMLIKIDVQGFEKMVILGGKQTIKKASVLIVEVSFYELYEDQEYFDSIYSVLCDLGFKYMGNYDQLYSPNDGSILQADAIFFKENG